jgi:hypothetical protein
VLLYKTIDVIYEVTRACKVHDVYQGTRTCASAVVGLQGAGVVTSTTVTEWRALSGNQP